MAHEIENMMYVGEVPWHGLGRKIEGRPTTADAIVAAGLDWEVGKKPLVTCDGEPVDHVATYRKTDNKILGVVGEDWTPLQNKDAFGFFDPFLATGEAVLETAGSLRGGKRVWVLALLNAEPSVIVPKANDIVRKYILLSNSHDGSLAIRVGFTPIRVVCANTLAMSHNDGESKLLKLRHTKNVDKALAAVQDIMNTANASFEATAEQYRLLAAKGCTDETLKKYVQLVFAPKKSALAAAQAAATGASEEASASRIMPKVAELFASGRGNDVPGVRGTMWAAYNAITEYLVHDRGTDAERRLNEAWFGQGAVLNARALNVGVEMAIAA